ncbi:MAG: hypothetical protein ACO1RT_04595 [Planctomycetaceae bacterium]
MARPKRPIVRAATTTGKPTAASKSDALVTAKSSLPENTDRPVSSEPVAPSASPRCPSPRLTTLLSIAIAAHFTLIGISYLSTVAASSVQADLLATFGPYLGAAHLDAEQIPLTLSSDSASEKTHQLLQTRSLRPGDEDWTSIASPGIRGGDRQRRWQRLLAATAELGENEEGILAAWLMLPIAQRYPDATQIRIDREPDITTMPTDTAAASPYRASIVRDNGSVRLVQVPPSRLTAPSTEPAHD